jgi:hypothetical protein
MEWWIIGALIIALIVMITVYQRSLRENRAVVHYAIILLLHDGIHRDHRAKLAEYVASIDAKNAFDLGAKVYVAMGNMAFQIRDSMALAARLDLKIGSPRHT